MRVQAERPVVLRGVRWICPASGRRGDGDIFIVDGRIAESRPGDARVVDARGLTLLPHFVEVAAHLGDPGYLWREDLVSGSAAGAMGGFGLVVATPDTDPVIDRGALLGDLQARASGVTGAEVRFAGALTVGLKGEELAEIGSLVDAGAVALSDGGQAIADGLVLRRALDYSRPFGLPVLLRPGEPLLEADGVVHEGAVALEVGLRGIPAAAEEIGVGRAIALARQTGARVNLNAISTAQSVAQVRDARQQGVRVTASAPARALLLTDADVDHSDYDTSLRLVPPLRPELDRLALVDAVRRGDICLTSAHLPLSRVEKEHEFERAMPGAAGLETAFAAALTALDGDIEAVGRALAVGPAELLGRRPRLEAGAVANLVLVDSEATIQAAQPAASRGVNEPLAGRSLRGRVVGTMVAGRWVYSSIGA